AFGTAGKALQVGMAASTGLQSARLAAAGAGVPLTPALEGRAGFAHVFGAPWPTAARAPAVRRNWIKAYPCCLATHSPIEAARALPRPSSTGRIGVTVHPLARAAAARDDVEDGLQAKFSIPYLVA